MKNKRKHSISIVLLVLALSMTALAGCGRNNRAEEPVMPVVTADPAGPAESVATPETETAAGQQAAVPMKRPLLLLYLSSMKLRP